MAILHSLILCLSLLDVVATAAIINVTHDDSPNETHGSVVISYLGLWSHQQVTPCNGTDQCADPLSRTRNGTWSTSLYVQNSRLDDQPPSVMFHFYGTAVYVSCVLIPYDMLGIDANSDMLFMLDGAVTGRFAGQSPKSGNISLATVLAYESLPKGSHTLRIQNGAAEDGKQTHNVSVLALDSITYTTEETLTPSMASNRFDSFYQEQRRKHKTHVILAAVMSSLAGIGIIVISFWFCLRRTQHKPFLPTIFRHQSTSRTVTPYSKASSSHTSLRKPSPQSSQADDDAHSVLSSVPPSYHSRSSAVS
ncbi:hypothetical protein BDN71DRAFT_1449609 [Pleurotus eryngii]|uniref:Uncharacterized protein n=1 Tax=Pleurotus eryngii TaxID=5323 RepID=A0A9P5ZVK8_PLEER|nr:hypothetical protein BDN71DRAFT_1449609 [Pleurotus eryngii]